MASSRKSGKFEKQCGTSFMHKTWNVESSKLLNRTKTKNEALSVLDRYYKDKHYTTTVSYCQECVDYVQSTCSECGSSKSERESNKTLHEHFNPEGMNIY